LGFDRGLYFLLRSNYKLALFFIKEGDKHLVRLKKDVSFLTKPTLKCKLKALPAYWTGLIELAPTDLLIKYNCQY
jgi:hypothetical protein